MRNCAYLGHWNIFGLGENKNESSRGALYFQWAETHLFLINRIFFAFFSNSFFSHGLKHLQLSVFTLSHLWALIVCPTMSIKDCFCICFSLKGFVAFQRIWSDLCPLQSFSTWHATSKLSTIMTCWVPTHLNHISDFQRLWHELKTYTE